MTRATTRRSFWAVSALLGLLSTPAALAQQGETVKVAWIDPLSGLMATIGDNQLKASQLVAEAFNKKSASGVKFEVIAFDNKLSPQETSAALRSAMDQGARYVIQGNGSGAALAIIDTLEKHNARNKGKEMLYINHGAVDPDLTNSQCSYWHFRVDADTSMKMEALTTYMKDEPDIKKLYLINQNYSHGQQVSKFAKEMLKAKRPDIEIVGDDFSPLAQVRDFAPYVAKIKASGADSVITGNWGTDLSLLMKAANDAGLHTVKFYTYYAFGGGTPTALAASGDIQVYAVGYGHYNMGPPIDALMAEFKQRANDDFTQTSIYHDFALLDAAFAKAASTDPVKVAVALEGIKITSFNGEIEIRKEDHQIQQGLYISKWQKAGGQYPYDAENTGYTFVPVKHIASSQASTPTTCQMKRPG